MDKIITLAGRSERGVFSFVIDYERQYLEKTAAEYHPTIASYINNARPIPGRTQILLTALGAGEYWGDNANADYFTEEGLAHEGPDYGYKTFETNAHVYKHHVNKDPAASYGNVPLAVYNPAFHRVELIVSLDNAKAPDIVEKHERGEVVDWSMGTKVPFDVCSICGNRAPTRKQYCDHARYHLGRLDPETGRKVFVKNTMPRFFDISYVFIGADRIAKTLRKVASYAAAPSIVSSAEAAEKSAQALKRATIEKEVPVSGAPSSAQLAGDLAAAITEVKAREEPLPRSVLSDLSAHPLRNVLSTLAVLGILPKPQEFQRLVLDSIGKGDLADELDSRGECFDPASDVAAPSGLEAGLGISARNFDPAVMIILRPFMEKRSYVAPHLGSRLVDLLDKPFSKQSLPTLVKIGNDAGRASLSSKVLPVLGLTAAMYAMLGKRASAEAVSGVDRLITDHPGLATALGLTLLSVFRHGLAIEGAQNVRGTYTRDQAYENPDVSNVFSRIDELKQKPYMKIAAEGRKVPPSDTAKRLYLGMPAAFMASGSLQKQREKSPHDEERRTKKFVKSHLDVVSGLCAADALLAAKAETSGKTVAKTASPYIRAALAAAQGLPAHSFDFRKVACAADYLKSSKTGEGFSGPSAVKGALFDQAALETSLRFLRD